MFSGPREKAPVFTTTNFVHIPFEEAKMRRQFGAAYDGYVARVGALGCEARAYLTDATR